MKKMYLKVCACVLSILTAVSMAACENDEKDTLSVEVSSVPVESVPEEIEEPDIGEHKDYDKENAEGYDSNGIIIVEQDGTKRGMEVFEAGSGYADFYANELNMIKDSIDPRINVYSMIVPTACELYCPSNMRSDIDSQEEVMDYVRDIFINIKEVNVLPTLQNHNAEEIYFRTDNRWAPLGAYYAGKAFAKTAGVDYADISQYKKSGGMDYVGNLSFYVGNVGQADLDANPDTFTYYEPSCKYTTYYYDEQFEYLTDAPFFEEIPDSLYDTFGKGGYYCLKLSTEVKNDRRLIIVKDSFGTILAPFLTSSFEEIYVVDIDYLEANLVDVIKTFKITDVLYVMNTFTVTSQRAYILETLRTQVTNGTIQDDSPIEDIEEEDSESTDEESEAEDDIQYVYSVGLNNQVSVIENSQHENDWGEGEEYYDNEGYDDGYYYDYDYDEEY